VATWRTEAVVGGGNAKKGFVKSSGGVGPGPRAKAPHWSIIPEREANGNWESNACRFASCHRYESYNLNYDRSYQSSHRVHHNNTKVLANKAAGQLPGVSLKGSEIRWSNT
jgi:hypothetical protein